MTFPNIPVFGFLKLSNKYYFSFKRVLLLYVTENIPHHYCLDIIMLR